MGKIIAWVWLTVIALLTLGFSCRADQPVRIGLVENQTEIRFEVTNGYQLLNLGCETPQPLAEPGDLVSITYSDETYFVNDIPVGAGPLALTADSNVLAYNNRTYRGDFLITVQNRKLTLINRLMMEEYLRGVVPREVSPSWEMASLKAQAIAARTYTIASLNRHGATNYDLCATTHCQVYGGATAEHPNTDRAVAETAGQIVTYNNKVISAFYFDSSGGYTSDVADVWGASIPYLKPVPDWDFKSPKAQWTKTFNWPEFQVIIAKSYPKIGALQQILPVAFGREGRVMKLLLKGAFGETTVNAEQFRYNTGLLSSNFQLAVIYGPEPCLTLWWAHRSVYPEVLTANTDVPGLAADVLNPPWDNPDPWEWLRDKEPVKVVIKGSGWGHGVGLSQEGAKTMAEAGYNERQILEYFYPGAKVTQWGN